MMKIKRGKVLPCFVRFARIVSRKLSFQTFGVVFLLLYILFVIWTFWMLYKDTPPVAPTHIHWKPPQHVDAKLEVSEGQTAFRPRQPEQIKPMECYNDVTTINAVSSPEFQTLDNEIFLLNAFYDARVKNETSIRILALRQSEKFKNQNTIYCLLNAGVDHSLVAVEASVYEFHDNQHDTGLGYGGYMLSCNVKGVLLANPCKVRLSLGKTFENKTVTMQLLSLKANRPRTEIGVCVPPIWGVVQMNKLVEFIELTQMLGADRMFFYQYMGDTDEEFLNPNIHHVLSHYKTSGDRNITVYPWKIPISAKGNLYYFGQSLAIQHCLYTNMWKYKYLIFNDIDEFLVPRNVDSWQDLMSQLDTNDANSTSLTYSNNNNNTSTATETFSSYCFKSPYFPPEVSEPLRTMSSLTRTNNMHQVHSKCMVHPDRVFEMGIYKIQKAIEPNTRSMAVGEHSALLHHYKNCEDEMPWNIKCFQTTPDETILKYNSRLVERFRGAMKIIATN